MTDTATLPAAPAPAKPGKGRTIIAVILFIFAAVLLPLGVTAYWGQRTITETEQYVETVAPLSSDPTIQDAVATTVSQQVTDALDVGKYLSQLLPAAAAPLVGPLTSALDNLIDKAVRAVMASSAFQQAWITINTAAQKSFIALLEGKQDGPLQTGPNGEVVLDTTALYQAVRTQMISNGVSFADKLPESPPKDRQFVLMQSNQLAQAQLIYSFTHPVASWLLPLVLVIFLLAVALAVNRARMVLAVGIAVLVSAVLLKIGLTILESQAHLALQNTPFATAETAFVDTLTRFLVNGIDWMVGIGIALAVLGWLFGKSEPAHRIRAWTGANDAVEETGFGGWLRRYGKLLALAIGVSAVAILIALNLTTAQTVIVSLALIAVGALLWFGMAKKRTDEVTAA